MYVHQWRKYSKQCSILIIRCSTNFKAECSHFTLIAHSIAKGEKKNRIIYLKYKNIPSAYFLYLTSWLLYTTAASSFASKNFLNLVQYFFLYLQSYPFADDIFFLYFNHFLCRIFTNTSRCYSYGVYSTRDFKNNQLLRSHLFYIFLNHFLRLFIIPGFIMVYTNDENRPTSWPIMMNKFFFKDKDSI